MAALDFPANPTVGQQYAAPNGVTYQWDGAAWVVTGGPPGQLWTGTATALTPTDTTKRVTIPGPTASGSDQSAILLGTRTEKARVTALPSADFASVSINQAYNGTTWVQDDNTKGSWDINLISAAVPANDTVNIERIAPGGSTVSGLLKVDAVGKVTIPGSSDTTDQSGLVVGSRTVKGRLITLAAYDQLGFTINERFNGTAWAQDDSTKPGWVLAVDVGGAGDNFFVNRGSTGNAQPITLLKIDNAGNLTILGPTGQKASGTTWSNPSDRRLKDDIRDYATGLTAILDLVPRTFIYNGKGGSVAGMRGYGFIADEVAPVMPEMVSTAQVKLDPDDSEETEIHVLDTSNLVLALVNAIKELAARLAALETHA